MDQPNVTLVDLKRELEEQLLWHYLELDDQGNLVNTPKTDDELHEFIRLALGVVLPRKVITPGHSTPFAFVADQFFERTKTVLGFASRTAGKTYAVGILNFLDLFFKRGCEIASAGATITQAERCYGYLKSFLEQDWFKKFCAVYEGKTGRKFLDKSIQSATEFANGSAAEIITGTEKGLRSPHPHKARIDEIDLLEWRVFQTGLSMAKSRPETLELHGIRGQNTFTSTRQVPDGTMQRLLDEAKAKNISVYEWDIWEVLEKCNRRCKGDPVYGDCPIYAYCQGKAHHCEGWYLIDDFVDKVQGIDRDVWETEWLNQKPQKGKLIYPMFEQSRHVMTPDMLRKITGEGYPNRNWEHASAIDFGSSPGHPFVYLKACRIPNHGAWLVYHEYVADQALLREHAAHIRQSPNYSPYHPIYADHDAQDRLELLALGIKSYPAQKDVEMGIDHVKTLLMGTPPREDPMLFFWHTCTDAIKQMGTYQRKTRADGSLDPSGKPRKMDDDIVDCCRYLTYTGFKRQGQVYRGRRISGI